MNLSLKLVCPIRAEVIRTCYRPAAAASILHDYGVIRRVKTWAVTRLQQNRCRARIFPHIEPASARAR